MSHKNPSTLKADDYWHVTDSQKNKCELQINPQLHIADVLSRNNGEWSAEMCIECACWWMSQPNARVTNLSVHELLCSAWECCFKVREWREHILHQLPCKWRPSGTCSRQTQRHRRESRENKALFDARHFSSFQILILLTQLLETY